jgi:hypothetical protein
MKVLLLVTLLALAPVFVFGQGTLNFANAAFGVDARIVDSDAQPLSGSIWAADLYWAPGVVADSTVLFALGQPTTFSAQPTGAGYFFGDTRTILGVGGGGVITAQVRVWNVAYGSSWVNAFVNFSPVGESTLFQVTLSALPDPPVNLTGLTSFSVYPPILIPEPNVLALAAFAVAFGFVSRHRHRIR